MQQSIIQLTDVYKAYGRNHVLEGLTLSVPEATIYGLLGRNGVGKTTTLRLIMSLIQADSGSVQIMGQPVSNLSHDQRANIGYASATLPLMPWLKVGQMLKENAAFYRQWDEKYVSTWLRRLSLDVNKRVYQLSRGEKQKLGFLMAIGHRPKLLVLDEPAEGLDPIVRQEFLESLIELLNETGTSILISSHQLNELERIADHIGLIHKGKMRLETDLESLRSETRRVILMGEGLDRELLHSDCLLHRVQKRGYLELVYKNYSEDLYQKLSQYYAQVSLNIEPLNLEEVFMLLEQEPVHA